MKEFSGLRASALVMALASGLLALGGCGGGGGGGSAAVRPTPPPAAPPPTKLVLAPSPSFSTHIALTNTAPAHAAGFTGTGVRIGVIDSGVNRRHPALEGRVVANLNYIGSPPNNLAVDDVVGHGTAVSQIMAGTAFGSWPGGIAPGASIVSARIISDKAPTDDGSGKGNEVSGALGFAPIHQDLINRGARIMNNSWGGLYWTNLEATAPIAQEYRPFVIDNDGLVVFSTGNSSFANPSSMAALPSQAGQGGSLPGADLERGWLAVAALDNDNPTQLASYSNACGVAMNYCLVAPGKVTVTGTNDSPTSPTYWNWSGTSFSAPIVSGAAALVWQAFPYFNNDLVRQTLLGTARDLGAPGVDAVFGHGALDVGAAVLGPRRLAWGDVTASFNSITSVWGNDISGAGGVVKQGTGRLELAGTNSYTGRTSALGGTLSARTTLPGDALAGTTGNLELRSGVAGNLVNQGTVTTRGTAAHVVGGDYQQAANARFAFEIGAPLQVTGRAQLDGGDAHVLGIATGYTRSAKETVLRADAGLTGRFTSLSAATGVFLQATLGYDPTTAWLDIQRLDVTATAQSMGVSAASVASAQRVEGAFDAMDGLSSGPAPGVSPGFASAAGAFQRTASAAAAEQSLASLSGELHAADAAFALMQIEGNRHALESRLDAGALARSPETRATGAWATSVGAQRALGSLDVESSGWMLGHDRRFGERWLIGIAGAHAEGLARHQVRGDQERNRQLEGQLYAQWQRGDDYLLGRVAAGRMQRTLQRDILLGADGFTVGSDYANRYATADLQFGRRMDVAGAVLTPYLGVHALRMERGDFTEQGAAGFGLSSGGSTLATTQGLLGVRFGREWSMGAARVALQARAEWQHSLSYSGGDIDARFTAIDVWAPILGVAHDRDVGVYGITASSTLPKWGQWSLGLDGRQARGRTDLQAFARWSMPF